MYWLYFTRFTKTKWRSGTSLCRTISTNFSMKMFLNTLSIGHVSILELRHFSRY